MANVENSSSYQSLGNGVYRVGGAVTRSAVTGRYVTSKSAARHPSTTSTESPAKSTSKRI